MKLRRQLTVQLPVLVLAVLLIASAPAQEKARFKNIEEAIQAGRILNGKSGPRSLNWIDGGDRYSYLATNEATKSEEIRAFNPKTGKDELIFDAKGMVFPDTNEPFSYQSFTWSSDSRHILFQTRFKKLYRRSGMSDYFVYSLADKSLKIAAKNAMTAELSPDGSMVGYERGGNMFVYDFATKNETQLTNDATKDIFNGHYDWVYEEEFGKAQADMRARSTLSQS